MSPPSLLILTNAITPDRIGGLERYVRELSEALAIAGADVMLYARQVAETDSAHEVSRNGVVIRRYSTPAKSNPLYAAGYPLAAGWAVAKALRDHPDRIVHTHFPVQGIPVALSRRPFVHTFASPVFREIREERQGSYRLPDRLIGPAIGAFRRGEQLMMRRPRTIITLSRFMADEARLLGATDAQLQVVPGGIDTDRFSPGEPIDDAWRIDGAPLLFTARRLVVRTGVSELVRAMSEIVRERPAAKLAIAGRGPLEGQVRGEIDRLGLGARVKLVGWVSDDDLVRWYRAADLVVLPTRELEGFGLATAEAMACGTPVVGTPAGATPELLGRLDTSLVAADPSAPAMANAVLRTLRVRGHLKGLAQRARSVVHPSMSWPAIAERHLEIYAALGRR